MRIYAMYDRKLWIVWLFIIFAAVDIAVGCWGIISNVPIATPPVTLSIPGCIEPISNEQGVHLAIAWSGQLGFDALMFLFTLLRSLTIPQAGRRTLINTLLRDGVIYFAVMTAANLANILTFLLAAPISKGVTSIFNIGHHDVPTDAEPA